MRAGGPNPGEDIAAESSEPDKEGGGGPSTTEKRGRSPVLIAALITAGATVVAAVITAVVAIVTNHGPNSTVPQATAPPHSQASDDMPVPNCPTCISGAGGRTFPEQAGGGSAKPTFRNPLVFGGAGATRSTKRKSGGGLPVLST